MGGAQMIYSKFMKHWEGGDVEYGYGVVQAPDGDFVIAGYLGSGPMGADACLMKLNPGGTPVWIRAYGGASGESAQAVRVMRDGGLAFAGNTSSFGSGSQDILVAKTDILGNVIWARAFGGAGYETGTAIDTTLDGGLIVCGSTASFGPTNSNFYVLKLDAVGNLQWSRVVGGPAAETAYDVIATRDGGYAVFGQTASFGTGLTDYYLVKLNALGGVVYTATYGGSNHDLGYRMGETTDGHLILGGYTNSFGVGSDGMLVKVALATGALVWARNYGSASMDRIFDVFQASDGNYVATGEGTTSTFGAGDQQVIKVSPAGGLIWARHYGTGVDETGYGMAIETRDHGILIAAWDDNAEDIFVNKMDSLGDSGCNNAAISISVGSPAIGVSSGGTATTGAVSTNVALPFSLVALTEVPYCAVVLPISEISLAGEVAAGFHQLSWHIAAAERFTHFAVEQRSDTGDFLAIAAEATVRASGSLSHAFVHPSQQYRIRLVDANGDVYYSNMVHLDGGERGCQLTVVHPSGWSVARQVMGLRGDVPAQWSVLDMHGKILQQGGIAPGETASIPLMDAATGMYVVRIVQGGRAFTERLLVHGR